MTTRPRLIVALVVTAFTIAGCASEVSPETAATIKATLKDDSLTLESGEVSSGRVSFQISNEGTMVHEFEILVGSAADLEIVESVADTSEMDLIDEVEDITPGTSVSLDVDLDPGEYVFICNLPGHVATGMVAELTVTG